MNLPIFINPLFFLRMSNFLFSHSIYNLLDNFQPCLSISKCSLQTLTVWKSLKFLVWEIVKRYLTICLPLFSIWNSVKMSSDKEFSLIRFDRIFSYPIGKEPYKSCLLALYSITFIQRTPKGSNKSGLLKQVVFK